MSIEEFVSVAKNGIRNITLKPLPDPPPFEPEIQGARILDGRMQVLAPGVAVGTLSEQTVCSGRGTERVDVVLQIFS